jgi:hypothetical protein
MQIIHNLKKSDDVKTTNMKMQIKQAILSVLFTIGNTEEGDPFIDSLGISKYNTDDIGNYFIPQPNEHLKRKKVLPASYDAGLTYPAFNGLISILNLNPHLYFYYGSETKPPCKEEVLWIVMATPRSISKSQFDYLLKVLGKNKKGEKIEEVESFEDLYGNKRNLIVIIINIDLRYLYKRKNFIQ